MSEIPQDLQALFSQDLTNVDLTRPVLKEGPTAFTVADVKVQTTKATIQLAPEHQSRMLVIQLKTRYDGLSNKGDKINASYPVTDRIMLTVTESRTAKRISEDLTRFQRACGRSGAFGEPTSYINCNLMANVVVEEDTEGQYGPQNRVRYIPADKAG